MTDSQKMSKTELRAGGTLALIFFLRMFGLFLIVPVFSLFALELSGSTPFLIGLALGIYGLTQALFQIPFGFISDRMGRKPVITLGLILFIAGSIVCAFSEHIYLMILGRALQGSGAVAAVIIALASDLSRPIHRTKLMAMIGMTIGLSFSLAFIAGPALGPVVGINGLFFITAILALLAIFVLYVLVPTPDADARVTEKSVPLLKVIKNRDLLRLDTGIFTLHLCLMANFVVVPLSLQGVAAIPVEQHWHVYLPVILTSILFVGPLVMMADKQGKGRSFFLAAIVLFILAQWLMAFFSQSIWQIGFSMTVFFIAFNFLEASLPSLVSKTVVPGQKGTALGVYSSCQFIGTFIGGLAGGFLYGLYGLMSVYLFSSAMCVLWLVFAWGMPSLSREEQDNGAEIQA